MSHEVDIPRASIDFIFWGENLRSISAQNNRFVKDQHLGDNDTFCPNNF